MCQSIFLTNCHRFVKLFKARIRFGIKDRVRCIALVTLFVIVIFIQYIEMCKYLTCNSGIFLTTAYFF